MSKKEYRGLAVRFVPTDGMNILTKTPSGVCEAVSVQYYINTSNPGVCNPESGQDPSYSINYDNSPF